MDFACKIKRDITHYFTQYFTHVIIFALWLRKIYRNKYKKVVKRLAKAKRKSYITSCKSIMRGQIMAESFSLRLQPECVETLEKIRDYRRKTLGVKYPKTVIISEAIAKLAKELDIK